MKFIVIMSFALALNYGCNSSKESSPTPTTQVTNEEIEVEIEGVVQKGPFISGADVSIYELDAKMYQTGKNFFTNTKNNKGKFLAKGKLSKNTYFEIVTNGYFFDEVSGQLSDGPITLKVISEVDDQSTANVNILTHMQSARMKKLMEDGKSFEAAQTQAANEVLQVFNINLTITDFKSLDLTKNSLANAALLYVSGVMMNLAHRNASGSVEAELVESLTNITEDLSADGDVDSTSYKAKISDSINTLNTGQIELNLKQRLTDIGEDPSSVPSLESYTSNPWTTIAVESDPDNLWGGLECVGSYCYLFGINNKVQRINVNTGIIEDLANMPISVVRAVVKVGTDLYLPVYVNGQNNQLWKYSTVNDEWTQLTSANFNHQTARSVVHVDGKIYLLSDNGTTNCEVYNIQTNSWSTIASNTYPRTHGASFYKDGKIYLLSGSWNDNINSHVPIEVYDIQNNSWSTISPQFNIDYGSLIGFEGQYAYLIASENDMGDGYRLLKWDVTNNTWQNMNYDSAVLSEVWGSMPIATTELLNGSFYSLGGNRRLLKFYAD